jgi:ABC-2 type transport system permease protein
MLGLGLCAMVFVGLVIGLSNSVQPSEIQEFMEKLPEGLRALLGISEGEMFDVSRWAGIIHDHPVWLTAICSFPLAASLRGVAGGVDDGSLEIVLAQPLSRRTYYGSLASVVALGVTVVLTMSLLGGLITRALVDLPGGLPVSTLVALSASGWALAMAVAGVALLSSVLGAGGGRPVHMAIGAIVVMYFFTFLSKMIPTLSWLDAISIFGYHDTRQLATGGFQILPFAVLLGVALACAAAGFAVFRRKQLTF